MDNTIIDALQKMTYYPSREFRPFLFGICCQDNQSQLYNFIADQYNAIEDRPLRKIHIIEWIKGIEFLYELNERYGSRLFHLVSNDLFYNLVGEMVFEVSSNLMYAKVFVENIQTSDNLDFIGDKRFNIIMSLNEIELSDKHKKDSYDPGLEFSEYTLKTQKNIMMIYHEYIKEYNEATDIPDGYIEEDAQDDAMYSVVMKSLKFQGLTENKIELVHDIIHTIEECDKASMTNDNLKNSFSEMFGLKTNLTVSAYFLHYILISLSVPSSDTLTPFGVAKITGKYSDQTQRLLCAITTKDIDTANKKSNTYYQAINRLFRFEKGFNTEKAKVLRHLDMARVELDKYGFVEAVILLDADYLKIKEYK